MSCKSEILSVFLCTPDDVYICDPEAEYYPQEIKILIDDFKLDSGFVKSSLDEEESSRIEREDDQTLIIVDYCSVGTS